MFTNYLDYYKYLQIISLYEFSIELNYFNLLSNDSVIVIIDNDFEYTWRKDKATLQIYK